ncbi:MAG: Ig-like domain-containing protein [Armatimonadota bacterium]|nr:Ig-like domain-containing protein [Armatimonadota bacterium]
MNSQTSTNNQQPAFRWLAISLLVILLAFPVSAEELFRLRITNESGGAVEVSVDEGRAFSIVGRVTKPALSAIASFGAAAYVPPGVIAATAIHGIRIKTIQMADGASRAPMTISIVPSEFSRIPKGYGGMEASSSGMYTDIPAGTAIFRTFAPFVGSPVYLQENDRLRHLGENYKPAAGDTLVVVTERPAKWPAAVEFENHVGGAVTAVYPDGSKDEITKVIWPVSGVGRYDGASYTGVGCINTNHGGVLTISTAPISDSPLFEGDGPERRGGFMVQPSYHATTQGIRVPQVMIIGPENATSAVLEGKPPLFYGNIALAYDPTDPANSYRAQVRIDGGEWERAPEITGRVDDAFKPGKLATYFAARGKKRAVKTGVTHIRVLFPKLDHAFLTSQLRKCAGIYSSSTVAGGAKVISGTLTINAAIKDSLAASYVTFLVDGQVVAITNSSPYSYDWDSCRVGDGVHTIEVRGSDDAGNPVSRKSTQIVVKNSKR